MNITRLIIVIICAIQILVEPSLGQMHAEVRIQDHS